MRRRTATPPMTGPEIQALLEESLDFWTGVELADGVEVVGVEVEDEDEDEDDEVLVVVIMEEEPKLG
jgi:hypothetical protein